MSRFGIIYILLIFFVSSCGKMNSVEIEELQEIKLKTLKGSNALVEVNLLASNPSSHNIYIKKADIEILRGGYSFGTASLHQKAVIKKHSKGQVVLLFDVKIIDKMAIMSGRIRAILAGEDRTELSFSGHVRAGTKVFSKSIPVDIGN
jgi:LEA14-like dessication related protein